MLKYIIGYRFTLAVNNASPMKDGEVHNYQQHFILNLTHSGSVAQIMRFSKTNFPDHII